MRRETGTLIGLEHIIRPAVLRRHRKIRVQDAGPVIDESKLRLLGTAAGAGNLARSIHTAHARSRVGVAHLDKRGVRVAQIVPIRQSDGGRLRDSAGGAVVDPVGGLDIVLRRARRAATGTRGSVRGKAQSVKQIVRSPVFLHDHHDVLKRGNLRVREGHPQARSQ